jgi:hypothetical protein
VAKREMRFWCFPTTGTLLCVFHQMTLVRKPLTDLDPRGGWKFRRCERKVMRRLDLEGNSSMGLADLPAKFVIGLSI